MAFRGDSTATYTYATNSTGGTVDMGARNNYRYVNATNVYNKGKSDGVTVHTGTYTFASGSTGSTIDLGTTHTYRYINATNVYNKGKSDGSITFKEIFSNQFEPGIGTRYSFLNSSAQRFGEYGTGSSLYMQNIINKQLSGYTYTSSVYVVKATCNVIQYIYIRYGASSIGSPDYQAGLNIKNISAINGTEIPIVPSYNNAFPTYCVLLFY